MISKTNDPNIAIFVDYENVATQNGHRLDRIIAEAEAFGSIVMLRAYACWDRYQGHRKRLQAAGFELIETPTNSGKNCVDIKLTVDAIETAFTKEFVDAFIIVSGDSDFVPLVVKLNELNRRAWLYVSESKVSPILEQFCYRLVLPEPLRSAQISASKPRLPPVPNTQGKQTSASTNKHAGKQPQKVSLTPEAAATIFWAMRACQAVDRRPVSINWLFAAIHKLDAKFNPGKFVAGKKRLRVRLAEYLHQQGYIQLNFVQQSKQYMLQAGEYLSQLSTAPKPAELSLAIEEVEYRRRRLEVVVNHVKPVPSSPLYHGDLFSNLTSDD